MEFYEVWALEAEGIGRELVLTHTDVERVMFIAQDQYPGDPPVDRQVWFVNTDGQRSLHWPS